MRRKAVGGGARVAAALAATVALALAGQAAFSTTSDAPPVTRLAGSDRFATAAAVSAASFPQGAPIVYIATGADFADALAAASAASGRGPVLLTRANLVPQVTADELRRLQPSRVVVVGGPHAVTDGTIYTLGQILPGATIARVAGPDRYGTAAALAETSYPNGARTVSVATGADYPDALAASTAGPVLLARSWLVPDATLAALRQLRPTTVHVVGSLGSAIVAAVQAAVPAAEVDHVVGADRVTTAAEVSAVTFPNGSPIAYVATDVAFPDALSAASAAGTSGPVLLAGEWTLPAATARELVRLGVSHIVVVGGSVAISDAVLNELGSEVATREPTGPPPPVSPKASTAIAVARQQLGKPYQWGGAGPAAFDCSGLTMYAWGAAGVSLPHNAQEQADRLPAVPLSQLQPGDLVFFGTPGNIGHVGMFIGNGQMIEAAHSGVPVRIADLQRPDLLIGGRPT